MGEPLTHPQLPEFIKLAGERGYKSIITTNGTLLKKHSQELLASGVIKSTSPYTALKTGLTRIISSICVTWPTLQKRRKARILLLFFAFGIRDLIMVKTKWHTTSLKKRYPEIKGDTFACYGLKDQFGILADGTVVPCCLDSDGVINLGNIFEEDIETILDSPRAKNLVEGFKCGVATEELCKRCGYAQRFV